MSEFIEWLIGDFPTSAFVVGATIAIILFMGSCAIGLGWKAGISG